MTQRIWVRRMDNKRVIAQVSYNGSELYWTHVRGYSDKVNATQADYDKVVKRYTSRSDLEVFEETS